MNVCKLMIHRCTEGKSWWILLKTIQSLPLLFTSAEFWQLESGFSLVWSSVAFHMVYKIRYSPGIIYLWKNRYYWPSCVVGLSLCFSSMKITWLIISVLLQKGVSSPSWSVFFRLCRRQETRGRPWRKKMLCREWWLYFFRYKANCITPLPLLSSWLSEQLAYNSFYYSPFLRIPNIYIQVLTF